MGSTMLRGLVLLLMLLNVGYLAWGQGWLLPYGFGPATQREPQRLDPPQWTEPSECVRRGRPDQ